MSVQENLQNIVNKTEVLKLDDSVKDTSQNASEVIEENNKVFVGNLNYKTTEKELRSLFDGIGEICDISMPVRRLYRTGAVRSQGIAFITFSTKDDAQKAIESCNHKELLDRKVIVTYANRHAPRRPKNHRTKTKPHKKHNESQGLKELADTKKNNAVAGSSFDDGVSGVQKSSDQSLSGGNASEGNTKHNRSRLSRFGSKRVPKGPPVNGVNSKSTVFVAGLSYDTSDEQLIEWFSEYNPLNAHIALRPLPRYIVERITAKGERRKGRGFGFVTFENEDMQNKAVMEMNDKEICGRRLIVKIAIDKPHPQNIVNGSRDLNTSNSVEN